MRILEDKGNSLLNDEAHDILKHAGCKIEGNVDRTCRGFMIRRLKNPLLGCILTPCKPKRQIMGGSQHISFGNVASTPNCLDYVTQKSFFWHT